jgi:hypothetical protein
MSEGKPEKPAKKDFERQAGRAKASRKGGKYILEIGGQKIVLDSAEDLMFLSAAIQQVMDDEWRELQEERRARGQVTYREFRGDQVVQEY